MSDDGQSRVPASSPLRQTTEDYLTYLRDEKRASPHTVEATARDLGAFADFCENASVPALEEINVHIVRRWIATLHRGGRQPRTVARMLSSLRGLLRREVGLGRLAANAAQSVRPPKGRRELPKTVEADILNSALDQGNGTESAWELRDQAIVELLYSTGMRLSELQALNAPAGSMPAELRVLGKGGKTRIVPVGGKARATLDRWITYRRGLATAGESALFIGRSGRRLTPRAIELRVGEWARRAGLPVHLHPHRLRHAFATHLLENSGELRPVQELLGHASLSTTQIYTALDWKHLAQVYDAAHPRARTDKTPRT